VRKAVIGVVVLALSVTCGDWGIRALQEPWRAVRIVAQPAPACLPVPVAGVSVRALRDSWGLPRSGGRRHEGIDIVVPRGAAVSSTTPGIVWRVGRNRLGGNAVWVLGPGGQLHYYAHLDRFGAIHVGEIVAPGDVLGYVGNTGNARGGPPHLHYGIYAPAAGAIDPFPILTAPLTRAAASPAPRRRPSRARDTSAARGR
jgi:murein DD-endopeptidase MepM/ murein hydrolase activator NlpD